MVRRCIFCGDKANSREDVWPVWLQARVNRGTTEAQVQIWRSPTAPPESWANAPLKARFVCRPCNNGWMSKLESANKDILGAIIGDFRLPLSSEAQQLLAMWTCKTTMVLECLSKMQPPFFSEANRRQFLTTIAPPVESVMWLGRYAHHLGISTQNNRLSNEIERPGFPLSEGYLSTFVFGRAVIQAFYFKRRHEYDDGRHLRIGTRPGRWNELLLQFWPVLTPTMEWPPSLSFSDAGETLDALTRRFTNPA